MSDLHLEFPENSMFLKQNEMPVTGEVLVLAGDIFYLKDKITPRVKFWKWASENYRQVLIVPGNHEYYNYSDVMERGLQWKWMLRKKRGILSKSGRKYRRYRFCFKYAMVANQSERRVFRVERHERFPADKI